ncbi:Gfa-like protein [Moraxella catarrhalis]|uniref:Gfa-like protein n=1 Tax=Moraxella catarrhalis TaxID=480 RepID=A0AB36DL22_MORCA|nr:Gfa-like protein [Moraxella catarrhalis]
MDFKLKSQIFIDKKAGYYELANDTPKLTEAEFIAMVTGE